MIDLEFLILSIQSIRKPLACNCNEKFLFDYKRINIFDGNSFKVVPLSQQWNTKSHSGNSNRGMLQIGNYFKPNLITCKVLNSLLITKLEKVVDNIFKKWENVVTTFAFEQSEAVMISCTPGVASN